MRDLSSSLGYLATYFKSLAGDEAVVLAPQALDGFANTFRELQLAAVEIEREKARLKAAVSDGVAAGAVIDLREALHRKHFQTASGGDAA